MEDGFEYRLSLFVKESNRIEGITRAPTAGELREHREFLALEQITVENLERFVKVVAPGKPLRREWTMNVRVGNHLPPQGGPHIEADLRTLLLDVDDGRNPYTIHRRYETLHPFMDGNGRSGRVLWLWQMVRQVGDPYVLRRGFLHSWYYQSLSATPERTNPAKTTPSDLAAKPTTAALATDAIEPLNPSTQRGRASTSALPDDGLTQ